MIRIRAVDVIPRVFEPVPGAKLSMCTLPSVSRQVRTKGSRRGFHGLADVVDEAFDQCRIVAFGHDTDQGLGARLANDQATAAFELRLGSSDALADAVGL